MTPQIIRARLLKSRLDTVKRIGEELKADSPHNLAELLDVLNAENNAVQAEILTMQREREQMTQFVG